MKKYSDRELIAFGLDPKRIPKHVAIIMDGNGRWATAKGLPRAAGHRAGVNALKDIIRFTSDVGVESLTLYAFSTENRKRPKDEIGILCGLLIEYFNREIDELHENGVRIKSIGDLSWFPMAVQETVRAAEKKTADNPGLKLNIALNYGGRAELLRAMKLAFSESAEPNETAISRFLYTADSGDVDLLIRTGGEARVSNFLLWQIAYAELYFTDVKWPNFTREELIKALRDFAGRDRRYGGLKPNGAK
ncbi:MAG: di-trans,poly-cis-decaprenylcistransferase [Clostridia bacterium]|nr:di-trans,poly-cis-decaprenylcistransferase [Clostridia bacterium]